MFRRPRYNQHTDELIASAALVRKQLQEKKEKTRYDVCVNYADSPKGRFLNCKNIILTKDWLKIVKEDGAITLISTEYIVAYTVKEYMLEDKE